MTVWFAAQGPSPSNSWTTSSRRPSPLGVAALRSAGEGTILLVASPRASSSCSAVGAFALRRSSQSAFSGGTEMSRRPRGGSRTCLSCRGRRRTTCSRHTPGTSVSSFHDCGFPARVASTLRCCLVVVRFWIWCIFKGSRCYIFE
jgi:hypothetical protein